MSNFIRDTGKYKPYELQHRFRKRIFLLIKLIILIFFIHLFISHIFIFTNRVNAAAMAPTLRRGNLIFVSPLPYGPFVPFSDSKRLFTLKNPERGDIVVYFPEEMRSKKVIYKIIDPVVRFFTLQNVASVSTDLRKSYPREMIRRVVGTPGDIIEIQNNEILIKTSGQEQVIQDYNPESQKRPLYGETRYVLGEEEYFLLGDNRQMCIDSRHFGPVPKKDIIGRVLFVYFPFNSFGTP